MQSCPIPFPESRQQMSVTKSVMLHQESNTVASQLRIDVPLPGVVPCPVHAGAHEAAGYPNLKLPGLS
jgi:hypothetical protein